MSGRTMYVHTMEGFDEIERLCFRVSFADEGVVNIELFEKLHTPSSWADLSAEIARALAIVCGPCIKPEVKS